MMRFTRTTTMAVLAGLLAVPSAALANSATQDSTPGTMAHPMTDDSMAHPMTDDSMAHPMTEDSMAHPMTDEMAMSGPSSPAATLRAGLTALLQEHVYLAGIAVTTALGAGGNMDEPGVAAAVAALDTNSVDLSKAIGKIYGADTEATFLEQWRAHIGFVVDYAHGKAAADQAMADKAVADLEAYKVSFAALLETVTEGHLNHMATESDLAAHINSLVAVVDAAVAKSPEMYANLRTGAGHMNEMAAHLAAAIAAQHPEMFAH